MSKKIIKGACFITCLFFAQFSEGKLLQDEKSITGETTFSFQEACKYLTKRDSPLIEVHSINQLNCMSEIKDINPFCNHKEAANPYYIRALVDKDSKRIKCLSSKRVILKYQCEGNKDQYCEDQDIGCFLLKEKLAVRLKAVYKNLSKEEGILKCYFDIGGDSLEQNI